MLVSQLCAVAALLRRVVRLALTAQSAAKDAVKRASVCTYSAMETRCSNSLRQR